MNRFAHAPMGRPNHASNRPPVADQTKLALFVFLSAKEKTPKFGCFFMAERKGFEPSKRIAPFTRFPSVLLRPLGHLSTHTKRLRPRSTVNN